MPNKVVTERWKSCVDGRIFDTYEDAHQHEMELKRLGIRELESFGHRILTDMNHEQLDNMLDHVISMIRFVGNPEDYLYYKTDNKVHIIKDWYESARCQGIIAWSVNHSVVANDGTSTGLAKFFDAMCEFNKLYYEPVSRIVSGTLLYDSICNGPVLVFKAGDEYIVLYKINKLMRECEKKLNNFKSKFTFSDKQD